MSNFDLQSIFIKKTILFRALYLGESPVHRKFENLWLSWINEKVITDYLQLVILFLA
jgi:hypothetical protein